VRICPVLTPTSSSFCNFVFMNDFLDQLNDVQKQAVTTTDGPVMVIAGPGSGKTRVLTFRIAHLISSGVEPREILSLTFTNKAAREMKERITKVIGSKGNHVWAGTFHSLFSRILRIEAKKLGYPSTFSIYDSDDSKTLIKDIINRMGLEKSKYPPGLVLNRISNAKSNLVTWKAYGTNGELISRDQGEGRPDMHKIYQHYVKRCLKAGAMDFDDLLLNTFRLFYENKDDVATKYRKRFRYVLVDEFQDTNFLQYAIVKQLTRYKGSEHNICIVGDDAQSIYAFRGATISNILDFKKDFPSLKVFKLEQNYRSTPHIVAAANSVISHNRAQIKKKIWTEFDSGNKLALIKALSDAEEARRVAGMIVEQKNRHHYANRDIAILYRTNAQSRVFEEQLRRQNIPYRIYGGMSFYQRKEVKDLMAYLRLAVNPVDDEAIRRVINYPKRGIGKTTLDKIMTLATSEELPAWEVLDRPVFNNRTNNLLKKFKELIASFIQKSEVMNAYDLALHIYKKSGIEADLIKDNSIEGLSRRENITALLDGIKEFIDSDELLTNDPSIEDRGIASYLQSVALITDFDDDDGDDDRVLLMSAHASKGLEFKSVFVVGLEENLFPSFMAKDSPGAMDEERRLFYVAITRAMEQLTLSYSNSRYQYGSMRFNDASRFLDEIEPEHFLNPEMVEKEPVTGPSRSRVSGVIPRGKRAPSTAAPSPTPSDFKVSDPSKISEGMKVRHLRFGEGEVLSVEGRNENRIATILFEEVDNPQKKIMLKFARLQILE
jgi:DNA helicase II / ATP-dependent DNA helicase PcrA